MRDHEAAGPANDDAIAALIAQAEQAHEGSGRAFRALYHIRKLAGSMVAVDAAYGAGHYASVWREVFEIAGLDGDIADRRYEPVPDRLVAILEEIDAWAHATFDKNRDQDVEDRAVLAHLREEADEALAAIGTPKLTEETADVIFLLTQLIGTAQTAAVIWSLTNQTAGAVHLALGRKLDVNKARTWDVPLADGRVKHRELPAPPELAS